MQANGRKMQQPLRENATLTPAARTVGETNFLFHSTKALPNCNNHEAWFYPGNMFAQARRR